MMRPSCLASPAWGGIFFEVGVVQPLDPQIDGFLCEALQMMRAALVLLDRSEEDSAAVHLQYAIDIVERSRGSLLRC